MDGIAVNPAGITNPFSSSYLTSRHSVERRLLTRSSRAESHISGYKARFFVRLEDDALRMTVSATCKATYVKRIRQGLAALGISVVILGVREDFPTFDCVGSDRFNGVLAALEYLYDLGYRRIGFVRGKHESGPGYVRLRAYQEFLERYHLPAARVAGPLDHEGGRHLSRGDDDAAADDDGETKI